MELTDWYYHFASSFNLLLHSFFSKPTLQSFSFFKGLPGRDSVNKYSVHDATEFCEHFRRAKICPFYHSIAVLMIPNTSILQHIWWWLFTLSLPGNPLKKLKQWISNILISICLLKRVCHCLHSGERHPFRLKFFQLT